MTAHSLRRLYIRQSCVPLALGWPVKHRAFGNLDQILVVRGAMHLISVPAVKSSVSFA